MVFMMCNFQKHLEKYCTYSLLNQCKPKVPWRISSHWSHWPASKRSTKNKSCRGHRERKILLFSGEQYERVWELWKITWRFLKKTKHRGTIWSGNPTAGFRSREYQNSKWHMYKVSMEKKRVSQAVRQRKIYYRKKESGFREKPVLTLYSQPSLVYL